MAFSRAIVGTLMPILLALAAWPAGIVAPARADEANAGDVAGFYKGKTMRMIIRFGPGAGYDTYARLLTKHMMKYVPGAPSVVNVNMPGAGGITAANYVANIAPKDGTILTIVSVGLPMDQAVGLNPSFKADLTAFNWVGNLSDSNQIMVTWHTSPTRTLDDAVKRQTIIAAAGAGSFSSMIPSALNSVLGTKFKIIIYQEGLEPNLAMERGEVEGRGTESYVTTASVTPQYLSEKKINILVQIGMKRDKAMPDVPLLLDYARTEEQRQILTFFSKAVVIGRPIATTPEVPKARVTALRRAFDEAVADPDFIADAKKQRAEISPMTGEETQQLVADLIATPAAIKAKVKAAFQAKSGIETLKGNNKSKGAKEGK
jgi:tripartite-type tricarboxylate transporter receptor subunit TctC